MHPNFLLISRAKGQEEHGWSYRVTASPTYFWVYQGLPLHEPTGMPLATSVSRCIPLLGLVCLPSLSSRYFPPWVHSSSLLCWSKEPSFLDSSSSKRAFPLCWRHFPRFFPYAQALQIACFLPCTQKLPGLTVALSSDIYTLSLGMDMYPMA